MRLCIDNGEHDAEEGRTLLAVCEGLGIAVPHLCHDPRLPVQGRCRLCMVEINGTIRPACLTRVSYRLNVHTDTDRLRSLRRTLLELLFNEGQHLCPTCERTGHCPLQSCAYASGMQASRYPAMHPRRAFDGSHPGVALDRDRCIQCGLCVAASDSLDQHRALIMTGRGRHTGITANAPSRQLVDTALSPGDHAIAVCPTGAFIPRFGPEAHHDVR